MKKMMIILLSTIIILLGVSFAESLDLDDKSENEKDPFELEWKYSVLEDGTLEIIGLNQKVDKLVVPSELDGKKVSGIGDQAFYFDQNITDVEISDGISYIGESAFCFCDSMTSVKIPGSVKKIGVCAFALCYSLKTVDLSEGLLVIEDCAFESCGLSSIELPGSLTRLGKEAFAFSDLTHISIPDSVDTLGDDIFEECHMLESITVGPGHPLWESIDGVLFNKQSKSLLLYPCKRTSAIYQIPEGTESIAKYAFGGSSLTSIVIPQSVSIIEKSAFSNCASLTSIVLPAGIEDISHNTFSGCKSLTEVSLPNTVKNIGEQAFMGCESLTSIKIPNNVTEIGQGAFHSCTSLVDITIPEGVSEINNLVFYDCKALTDITIPENVNYIGYMSFSSCESLNSVVIPGKVEKINEEAFSHCRSLKEIVMPESVKWIGDNAFMDCGDVTIIVPHESAAERYCKINKINYINEQIVINEQVVIRDDIEINNGTMPSEYANILGTWHSIGYYINNVLFELPNYNINYILNINRDGSVSINKNGSYEEGEWKRSGTELLLALKKSGDINCIITEKYILMKINGIDVVFATDNISDNDIPQTIVVNDDRQFNGKWKVSRVISQYCSLSPSQLFNVGVDDGFYINISNSVAEVVLSRDDPTPVVFVKALSEGKLILFNYSLGTSVQMRLTTTGEMVFHLYEDGADFIVCMINVYEDAEQMAVDTLEEGNVRLSVTEKGFSVSIPQEIASVTREADSSDKFYHSGHGDYTSLHSIMMNNNMYVFGMTKDNQNELSLQVSDYSDYDFNTANDALLTTYTEQLKQSLGWAAKDVEDDLYQGKSNKAIRIHYRLDTLFAGNQYILLYYTTYGSNLLKMQFLSYGDEITSEQEQMVQEIFDSIEWSKSQTDNRMYSDQETGISFMIPYGWDEEKNADEVAILPMKFRIGMKKAWVSYEKEDIWEKYYEANSETADMIGLKRSNYFLLHFPDTIVAQQLGCDDYMITYKRLAGKKYYYLNEWKRDRGQEIIYYYFENGYMYKFIMNGNDANSCVDQLEQFLMTVEYKN